MARKYSSEYKALQPYVVEDIRKVVNAVGAAGGTGSGGLEVHALSGAYHSGELAQTQASWAATKVELSNHAALPDAHHAKLHAITDAANHSVTGSQYQIVGLTAVNTLGLLTAASSPTTNQVVKTDGSSAVTLVDLTVTSDLFMSGYLDFGTDVMYEDASYLQVTGSKAVRFGQNIGTANWTINSTGAASFGGSVDIVGSGDLYVAGSLGGAGGVLKTSGNRVGIACVPDSQFALDVAGPARAQYFIGPHAIQIPDALMICHYDGAQPYNTNFTGITLGHMGQVGTIGGGVVFRPGKFGKALQTAEACTNYFTDPSCEYDASLSLWSKYNATGTLTATRNQDVTPLYGTYVGRLVQSATGTGLFYQTVTVPAGTAALSCYVRKLDKSAVADADCNLYYDGNKTTTYTAVGDGWYRLTWTGGTSGASFLAGITVKTSKTIYVDGFQIEATNITPYCDGSLGNGHTWSGTANASTSARTWASLQYTLPTIAADAPLTLMTWANLDTATSKNYHYLWYTTNDGYSVYLNSSRTLYVGTLNCGTLPAGWVHVALTTDGTGTITAYVNGASKGTASITRSGLTTFNVGSHSGGLCANGLIDDFAIIGRALPANEIKSIYESNAPIFAETATVSWVATPGGLVWADERGLWMRGKDGNPVLGVYGGEASTYSWAGSMMEPGDLVLGYNAVGSSAIWWDKSYGTFGFYGGGSSTPQVIINADGTIGALNGNFSGTLAIGASGKITAGSTEISSSGVLLPRATISSGDDVFDTPNLSPGISVTQRYSDTAVSWPATDGTRNYAGNTLMRLYSSSEHYVPSGMAGGSWAHALDGVIEAPSPTTPADSGLWMRRLWLLVGSKYLVVGDGSGASGVGINIYAPKVALHVGGSVAVAGDEGGYANATSFTNAINTTQSTGTGTVKMAGATSRNNVGFIKVYIGTTAAYIPYWTTITG